MAKKIMIGVTPDTHDGSRLKTRSPDEKIVYIWDRYLRAVMDHGAVPVLLPVTDDRKIIRTMAANLDGFLLAGGNFDVPPEYFGEDPRPWLGKVKRHRSRFERELLLMAARGKKPVLGICGGLQIINVAFGGTLYQDILEERPHSRDRQQEIKRTRPSHQATVEAGTLLHRVMSGGRSKTPLKIRVNSTHHQAVKDLGAGIRVNATAPDGVIEAIEKDGQCFMLGVQWHPEMLYPKFPEQSRIFSAFVRAARNRGR